MIPLKSPKEIEKLQAACAQARAEAEAATDEPTRLRAMARSHPWHSPKPPTIGFRIAYEPQEGWYCIYDNEGFVTATKSADVLLAWLKANAEDPGGLAEACGLERRIAPIKSYREPVPPKSLGEGGPSWEPQRLPGRPVRPRRSKITLADLDL